MGLFDVIIVDFLQFFKGATPLQIYIFFSLFDFFSKYLSYCLFVSSFCYCIPSFVYFFLLRFCLTVNMFLVWFINSNPQVRMAGDLFMCLSVYRMCSYVWLLRPYVLVYLYTLSYLLCLTVPIDLKFSCYNTASNIFTMPLTWFDMIYII